MQYAWAVVLGAAILLQHSEARWLRYFAGAIAIALLGLRLWDVMDDWRRAQKEASQNVLQVARDSRVLGVVADLPTDALLVSNIAYVFRIELGLPARHFVATRDGDSAREEVERLRDVNLRTRRVFVVLDLTTSGPRPASRWLKWLGISGFAETTRVNQVAIFEPVFSAKTVEPR